MGRTKRATPVTPSTQRLSREDYSSRLAWDPQGDTVSRKGRKMSVLNYNSGYMGKAVAVSCTKSRSGEDRLTDSEA